MRVEKEETFFPSFAVWKVVQGKSICSELLLCEKAFVSDLKVDWTSKKQYFFQI